MVRDGTSLSPLYLHGVGVRSVYILSSQNRTTSGITLGMLSVGEKKNEETSSNIMTS